MFFSFSYVEVGHRSVRRGRTLLEYKKIVLIAFRGRLSLFFVEVGRFSISGRGRRQDDL